ncbi:uncharacterized protein LOC112127946 isoform X2 [Cimex lectularius]|uniref:Uncharacterized protein n=1 Tax=Cimex lectularius TaxID=79782 RepID=A0A8I6SV18_CIMLE|nr:uncharacterized protein LOC112127946 isoform X2 [Cimex lectularius]
MNSDEEKKVCYLYDSDIGSYYYGQDRPMKSHGIRMRHNLLLNYGPYRNKEFYVEMQNYEGCDTGENRSGISFLRGTMNCVKCRTTSLTTTTTSRRRSRPTPGRSWCRLLSSTRPHCSSASRATSSSSSQSRNTGG